MLTDSNTEGVPNLEAQALTPSLQLELVREHSYAEFAAYFPRWANQLQKLSEDYQKFLRHVDAFMEEHGGMQMKEFATVAEKHKYLNVNIVAKSQSVRRWQR